MKDKSILYNIKKIDTLVIREFIKNDCHNDMCGVPTPTQMMILGYIINHPDTDIYQKDLEDILKLRRATVSGVLQTMEKNNLIERVTDKKDTRIKRIIIKDGAKKIFLEHQESIMAMEKALTEEISFEEKEEFLRIINIIHDNLIKYSLREEGKQDV